MEVSPSGKALDSDSSMRRFKSFYLCQYVDMAELADALDSGSSEWKLVQVQILLSTPIKNIAYMTYKRFFVIRENQ